MLYEVITPGSQQYWLQAFNNVLLGRWNKMNDGYAGSFESALPEYGKPIAATIRGALPGVITSYSIHYTKLYEFRDSKIDQMRKGDELPPGVIKLVKVFVATKRRMISAMSTISRTRNPLFSCDLRQERGRFSKKKWQISSQT